MQPALASADVFKRSCDRMTLDLVRIRTQVVETKQHGAQAFTVHGDAV